MRSSRGDAAEGMKDPQGGIQSFRQPTRPPAPSPAGVRREGNKKAAACGRTRGPRSGPLSGTQSLQHLAPGSRESLSVLPGGGSNIKYMVCAVIRCLKASIPASGRGENVEHSEIEYL